MIELDAKFKTFELREGALRNSVAKQNNETLTWKHQDDEKYADFGYCSIEQYIEKEINGEFYLMISYFSCKKMFMKSFGCLEFLISNQY